MVQWPNILVLSAGGYGHIPIPLLKQVEPLLPMPSTSTDTIATNQQHYRKPVGERTNFISYVGSLEHDPFQLRPQMNDYLQHRQNQSTANEAGNVSITSSSSLKFYTYYYGDDWRKIMWDSQYSLAPRGFGRTSYHLMEILQSGLIPIHVYKEVPWIPYATLYREKQWGYQTTIEGLPTFVDTLLSSRQTESNDLAEVEERELRIASYRESHFTTQGVLEQIRLFLLNDIRSDLECTALPNSTLLS